MISLPQDYLEAKVRFAIVAGEPSGDQLAQGLVKALKDKFPDAVFVGIPGPLMQEAGVKALYPMHRLSVMGFFEPLKRAFELLTMRRRLAKELIKHPPTAFIGIDAPDFNLGLEKKMKRQNIPTFHYVSPTIWAWRAGRIHDIKKAVDHMLLIFPFEKALYERHQVEASYVGHALARSIELQVDKAKAKQALHLDPNKPTIAFLPGSRVSEIKRLAADYFQTMQRIQQQRPEVQCVCALLNEDLAALWQEAHQQWPKVKCLIRVNQTRDVLKAADAAMVKSGTATLEASLCKTPHIVVYRVGALTYRIAKWLIKTDYIAMTNIIAQKALVTEYIQHAMKPKAMAEELIQLLDPQHTAPMIEAFYTMHQTMDLQSNELGAQAIMEKVRSRQDADNRRG